MAKGSIAKEEITKKLLEIFPGAFPYEKEIRIPIQENGETVQIKVTLTCAKTNVEVGGNAPTQTATTTKAGTFDFAITEEEKSDTLNLIESLGL